MKGRRCHERYREYQQEWQRLNANKVLLYAAKARAKRAGLPFDIDASDIIIPSHCPVLGIPIQKNPERLGESSPTLDKIVPSKGYVKGNVAVISARANRLKSDASLAEIEALVAWLRPLSAG